MTRERLVHVITDAPDRDPRHQLRRNLRALLRPTALISLIAGPVLAATAIPVGLLLGWHPLLILCALILAAPVLTNLLDLLAARLGYPPLAWVAGRLIANRPATKENPTNG